jgi:hypothetical protein
MIPSVKQSNFSALDFNGKFKRFARRVFSETIGSGRSNLGAQGAQGAIGSASKNPVTCLSRGL